MWLLRCLGSICGSQLQRTQDKQPDRDQPDQRHPLNHDEDEESKDYDEPEPQPWNHPLGHHGLLLQCQANVQVALGIDLCRYKVWSLYAVIQAVEWNVGADHNVVARA